MIKHMKRCIFTKVKFMALFLFAALMAACTADVYEPKPDPTPTPEPEIPENPIVDIVNSISKSRNLTVNVADAYDGKYYYTIEVFVGNPVTDENVRLLAGQKTNSKVPFSVNINIPDSETDIFIRQTDPFKRKRVYAFPVQDGDMVCDLGSIANTKSSSGSVLRSASVQYDIPEVDFTVPSDAKKMTSGSQITREGGTFLVEKGVSVSLSSLPWATTRLYIKGTVILNGGMSLQNNGSIYVLDGGKLIAGQNVVLQCNTPALIAVENGGTLGNDDKDLSLALTGGSAKIVNYGEIELTGKSANGFAISISSGASIYNAGEMDIEGGLVTYDSENYIYNNGEIEIDHTLMLTNGKIYNSCVFEADQCDVNGGSITLASGSIFECENMKASGLKLTMDALSVFDCEEKVTYQGNKSFISGASGSTDYALFRAKEVRTDNNNTGWDRFSYTGMVEIECEKHVPANNKGNTIEPPAAFAQGQASVEIENDDCNRNSGNQNPGEGDGDQDPSYEEAETLPYTYLFEDNWPATGDYDMNDLVIGIQINNKKMGGKTESAKIIYTLYATGATKQIGVGFQLDGIPASAVSGAEQGQTNAVIQLFSDAHSLLGSSERTPINTYKITAEPVVNEVTVNFNTPIDGVMNVNNFNLFIVTNGFDSDRRNEVHIAGYKGTDKAASSENSTANYVSNETGLMWALSIPSQDFATYPKETIRIDDAYEGFGSWIKGDNTPGWYLNYVEDNVIKYDLFTNKTE
jgi:LruC domain-containing protein